MSPTWQLFVLVALSAVVLGVSIIGTLTLDRPRLQQILMCLLVACGSANLILFLWVML